jgi:hypothetical protein
MEISDLEESHYINKITELNQTIKELKQEKDEHPINNLLFLIQNTEVQLLIKQAQQDKRAGKTVVQNILTYLLEIKRPASYKEIADAYSYKNNSGVSSGASALERVKVIKKEQSKSGHYLIDFDEDSLKEIILNTEQRRKLREAKKSLFKESS